MSSEHKEDEHLILVAGAESDGVKVYVRLDGSIRLYRAEYIANAGFQTEEDDELEDAANAKEPWSRDLNQVLRQIRMPWHCFSCIELSPSYAEQIVAVQRSMCDERGGEPIFLATSRKVTFLDDCV